MHIFFKVSEKLSINKPLDIKHIWIISRATLRILHIHKWGWKDVKGCCLATAKIAFHLFIYLFVFRCGRQRTNGNRIKTKATAHIFQLFTHHRPAAAVIPFHISFNLRPPITWKRREQGQMSLLHHLVGSRSAQSKSNQIVICSV